MSVLKNMVRLHRWDVDEKRRKLVDLEALRDKMRRELEALEEEVEREKAVAGSDSLEGGYTYPAFLNAALERRRKMVVSLSEIGRSIEAARDELKDAFQAVKRYESALESHERRGREKRAAREQLALDQQGLDIHRRKASRAE